MQKRPILGILLVMADRLRPPVSQAERTVPVLTARVLSPEKPSQQSSIETVLKTDSLVLLTGRAHPKLAHAVGKHLSMIVDEPIVVYEAMSRFTDGEIKADIKPNLRNRDVFFIQGHPGVQRVVQDEKGSHITMSVNDAVEEINIANDAAKKASAKEINDVIPYYYYGRQDRKDRPRASISAAMVARNYKTSGANRIVTMDLHAEQEQGFVDIPWDNLEAAHVLIPEIQKLGIENLVIASPDLGGVKRAKKYKDALHGIGLAVVIKDRDVTNGSIASLGQDGQIIGDVKGKPALIVDDIIGSGGTAKQALDLLKANGATDVYLAVAHGIFTEDSLKNLAGFKRVFFTDSVNHDGIEFPENMTEVSIAPLLAEVIKRIHTGESLSKGLFLNGNGHEQQTAYNPLVN